MPTRRGPSGYSLERLELHCHLILLDRRPIGRLEQRRGPRGQRSPWRARLTRQGQISGWPAPFEKDVHEFETFAAAVNWLGIQY
jgi:hypothetical protein